MYNTYDASGQERTDLDAQHAARDRYALTADGPDVGDEGHRRFQRHIQVGKLCRAIEDCVWALLKFVMDLGKAARRVQ